MAECIAVKKVSVKFACFVNNIREDAWNWMIVNADGEEQWMTPYLFKSQEEAKAEGLKEFEKFLKHVSGEEDDE